MRECHQGSWLKHATSQKPNIDLQSIDQFLQRSGVITLESLQ
jgi:hypothetical protein